MLILNTHLLLAPIMISCDAHRCLLPEIAVSHEPGIVQELQWRSWASWLPTRFNFRRATTTPQIPEGFADLRFQSVSVGASFFLAIDGIPLCYFSYMSLT